MATGAGGQYAKEFHAAATELLECGRDMRKFANESEAVLGRFHRALLHLSKQGYSDEGVIVRSIGPKGEIVHFLLDCVRNRFLLWRRVRHVKELLCKADSSWSRAFVDHVASCPTCKTVDLARDETPPPQVPQARWPIPFALELLAFLGLALPLCALGQGCDCRFRPALLALGLALAVPWLAFEAVWRCRRGPVLARFAAGDYAVGMRRADAGCCWCPSGTLLLDPLPEPEAAVRRSATSEQPSPGHRAWVSFGMWHTGPPTGATVRVCQAPFGDRGSDSDSGASSLGSGEEVACSPAWALEVTCDERHWAERAGTLRPTGSVEGLAGAGAAAAFDGNALVLCLGGGGGEEAWAKLGCCRLDWVRRVLLTMAALGLLIAVVATALPPGIVRHCGPTTRTVALPTPLNVFILLDASFSITGTNPEGWNDEKLAANKIIDGFAQAHGASGTTSGGVAQFSSGATLEVPLTSDLDKATRHVSVMRMDPGATEMEDGLRLCQEQLSTQMQAAAEARGLSVRADHGRHSNGQGCGCCGLPGSAERRHPHHGHLRGEGHPVGQLAEGDDLVPELQWLRLPVVCRSIGLRDASGKVQRGGQLRCAGHQA